MASVKNLKKDVNYVLGDIVDAVYLWEMFNPTVKNDAAQVIVDEAFASYDTLIAKINKKNVENKKAHFKAVRQELEQIATSLVRKINSL
ncbi:MAG: hypothetical protein KGZ87_02210 [Bacteroidetes bacterium]|nr:hypothetical protein [Bacteroidota bacterium]